MVNTLIETSAQNEGRKRAREVIHTLIEFKAKVLHVERDRGFGINDYIAWSKSGNFMIIRNP